MWIVNFLSRYSKTFSDNVLLNVLMACEPETILAMPNYIANDIIDNSIITTTLMKLIEKQLKGTIDWAKRIPAFTDLKLQDQMKLLRRSWSDVLILSLVFHTLPNSVTASMKVKTSGTKWELKFAPDFLINENVAKHMKLHDFYQEVCRNGFYHKSNSCSIRIIFVLSVVTFAKEVTLWDCDERSFYYWKLLFCATTMSM